MVVAMVVMVVDTMVLSVQQQREQKWMIYYCTKHKIAVALKNSGSPAAESETFGIEVWEMHFTWNQKSTRL